MNRGLSSTAQKLLDHWRSIRNGRQVPRKADFDPMQVHDLLSNLWIYEFDREINDFVCRLAGESIHSAWGRRVKGLTYREIVGDAHHPAALERWRYLLERPAIQHSFRGDLDRSAPYRVAERLVLPLASVDVPDRLLGYSRYELGQDQVAVRPDLWDDVTVIDCKDL